MKHYQLSQPELIGHPYSVIVPWKSAQKCRYFLGNKYGIDPLVSLRWTSAPWQNRTSEIYSLSVAVAICSGLFPLWPLVSTSNYLLSSLSNQKSASCSSSKFFVFFTIIWWKWIELKIWLQEEVSGLIVSEAFNTELHRLKIRTICNTKCASVHEATSYAWCHLTCETIATFLTFSQLNAAPINFHLLVANLLASIWICRRLHKPM